MAFRAAEQIVLAHQAQDMLVIDFATRHTHSLFALPQGGFFSFRGDSSERTLLLRSNHDQ
jgi:hypothetical protein